MLLYSALPLSCPFWHNAHLHQSEVYFWNEHEIAWNLSKKLVNSGHSFEHGADKHNSVLAFILPEKATGFLSMDSGACSISLGSLEQGCPGDLKGFGACFSNIGLRCGRFLIKPFFWWES